MDDSSVHEDTGSDIALYVKGSSKRWSKQKKNRCIVCVVFFVLVIIGIIILSLVVASKSVGHCGVIDGYSLRDEECRHAYLKPCDVKIVESIPENLTFSKDSPSHISVFDGWMHLLDSAETSIHIASSYWTLRSDDVAVKDPSSLQGQIIFDRLMEAGKRGIDIRIVHQVSTKQQPNNDTIILKDMGLAQVRSLDLRRLLGNGILHSKMWLVDNKHFYVGSANMDWRSLTQNKELGLVTTNCTCLAVDMAKIFDVYWTLAEPTSQIPHTWPHSLDTSINKDNPLPMIVNGKKADVYLSSSPPPLCPDGRTSDIDSILDVIGKAQKFINISVMDYSPTFLYSSPQKYWAVIDDALREAAFNRGVKVNLMASIWPHTRRAMIPFLKSLSILNDIEYVNIDARLFRVPYYTKAQENIPYARVQHTKYMVTDNAAYVGTSNWSGDYFVSTGGIGYIINQTMPSEETSVSEGSIQDQLKAIFIRDWNSNYTKSIWEF